MQFSQPSPSVLVDPIMAKTNAFKFSIAYEICYCYLTHYHIMPHFDALKIYK